MAEKKRLEEAASSTYQTLLERLQPAVDSLGEAAFASVEDRFRMSHLGPTSEAH